MNWFFVARIAAVALAVGAVWWNGHSRGYAKGHAETLMVQAKWDGERAGQAAAAAIATDQARTEEERRRAQQLENFRAFERQQDRLIADRDALHAAGDRLRLRTAAIAATCGREASGDPGASHEAADAPGPLLADVQSRLVEAARQLAEYADALKAHNDLLQRDYEALRPPEQ